MPDQENNDCIPVGDDSRHEFEARYDDEVIDDHRGTNKRKTYVCDICVWCGKVIPRYQTDQMGYNAMR